MQNEIEKSIVEEFNVKLTALLKEYNIVMAGESYIYEGKIFARPVIMNAPVETVDSKVDDHDEQKDEQKEG